MEVNCEGCAGCCIDWRPLAAAPDRQDHERRGPHRPLDDTYNLVPLTRETVRRYCEEGLGDALVPRLWLAEDDHAVTIDGHQVAAVGGKPAFFVGLRKPPKPVAPFGIDGARWLRTCVFLDPATLQCRVHGSELYPTECAEYPGHNLVLDRETECERVEAAYGGDRLVDDEPPGSTAGLLLGPQALGEKVFVHPDPDSLDGVVQRAVTRGLTRADRAEFVATAAASAPGTTERSESHYERYRDLALGADSWVGQASRDWEALAGGVGTPVSTSVLGTTVEEDRGAPATPGWDAVE
ncbi:YkgJ family cysteine cluster protein [Haloarchaeobius amylolyticus]|uniref:YkgJ family cysteine cluster protein n=1 Tax=Haloarchaeobius amylolyticus TaxID=1198296 RepID=UPI00227136D0|nr:YkgJ family cysteine cluster protein [Haloarchaeobius amylolyticus]